MKIGSFKFVAAATDAEIEANERAARTLGLPDVSSLKPSGPLAIVGCGPSIEGRKHALRNWKGEIWAINNAAIWCVRNRIRCSMFTIDPGLNFNPDLKIVSRAILATRCHPFLFDLLRGADLRTFELPQPGPSSAPTAAMIGAKLGFKDFTFFGCEASFAGHSHAEDGPDPGAEQKVVVACAGEKFMTRPDFISGALAIAMMVRDFEHVRERSGGLLAALVKDLDYEIVGVAPALAIPATDPALIEEYRRFAA